MAKTPKKTNRQTNKQQTDYEKLAAKFVTYFQAYDSLKEYDLKIASRRKESIENKRQWIEWLEKPEFLVAFLGSFSAGKSTVINSMLNRSILPENTKSTTAVPTYIKKGNQDFAIIRYVSNKQKQELVHLYMQEVAEEIAEIKTISLQSYNLYDEQERENLLNVINEKVNTIEDKDTLSKSLRALAYIKKIIDEWSSHPSNSKTIDDLGQLKDYVTEDAEGILFIDRVEVSVKDIDVPTDIVLVDLPGLGVANKRHQQVTKNFIEKEAKAFVVCMKPFSLLEGEEIEFLEKMNKQNPSILQRAFWLTNQWDTLLPEQRKQEESNFNEKVKSYGFKIDEDRVFKVSALVHLLLNMLRNESKLDKYDEKYFNKHKKWLLEDKYKELGGKKGVELEQLISEKLKFEGFPVFHQTLFNYLNNNAKTEFLEYGRLALQDIQDKLLNVLEPLVKEYGLDEDKDLEKIYIAEFTTNTLNELKKKLCAIIEQQAKTMRLQCTADNFTIWEGKQETKAIKHIKEKIKSLDRSDLRNELARGKHLDHIFARLPEKIEQKELPQLIEQVLIDQVRHIVYKNFSNRLLEELRKTAGNLLPKEIDDILADKLSDRDLTNRIRGLTDCLFYLYGDTIEQVGSSIADSNKKVQEKVTEKQKKMQAEGKTSIFGSIFGR